MPEVKSVHVIGAGLIGTSIALGLRERGVEVSLADVDSHQVRAAVDRGAGAAEPQDDPDLVVISVPPAETADAVMKALADWPDAVVTDVASVKGPIAAAMDGQPNYVGSHPMAGRERSGPSAASGRLFEGRPWVIVPVGASRPDACDTVQSMAELLGAVATTMDAATHDRAVALVSHVPQVLSVLAAARLVDAPEEHVSLAGPGLRDVTRIAASDPDLWTEILAGNAGEVAAILRAVQRDLSDVVTALESDPSSVTRILESGRAGTSVIPGKHGDQQVALVPVFVVVADRPRELERVVADAGQSGVNIEDLRIQHELGRPAGVVEFHVLPEQADTLVDALVSRGWPAYL